ncbi:hypothetical protein ACIPJG_25560 [Streptomyces halstedii]|uniref:hypothetical protein n=1 Tax=Streptomyces halstedii TaxID=1944 RepID=UPI00345FE7B9
MAKPTALRDLPPHLRLLAWPALNDRGHLDGVRVSLPAERAGDPPSVACYSRGTTVEFDAARGESSAGPEFLLTAPESEPVLAAPLRLVSTLALWDEVVREAGVYAGNIYLASESSVACLLNTAHAIAPPAPAELTESLEQLHAMELLYRFPVAYKFRGAHGAERQCRINGWGRLLFRMLNDTCGGSEGDRYGIGVARERLARHVQDHRGAYLRGVRAASAADDHTGARIWEEIHVEQPIPVLI